MNRRELLATGTITGSTFLVGCQTILDGFEQGIELTKVRLLNSDTSDRRFDVEIRKDAEVVHRGEYIVEGERFRTIGCSWSDSKGVYVISARIAGGDRVEQDLTEVTPDGECISANIFYRLDGPEISTGMKCYDENSTGCGS